MSTTTTTFETHGAVQEETSRRGWLDRAFRRFMSAREARARALVDGHLARLNDASLMDLGYEPVEIRRIRARDSYPSDYWI
jgi:hypothetical protein